MEVKNNPFITGIAQAINSVFGDEYEIITENSEQGLKEPCFLITQMSVSHTGKIGLGSERVKSFVVQYFPESRNNLRMECDTVSDALIDCLEYIQVHGSRLRGKDIESKVVDGVLNFSITFHYFVRRTAVTTETMGSINIE